MTCIAQEILDQYADDESADIHAIAAAKGGREDDEDGYVFPDGSNLFEIDGFWDWVEE